MSNLTFLYEGPGCLEILETQKCYKKSTEKKNFFQKYYYDVITKNKIFFEKKNFSVSFYKKFFSYKFLTLPALHIKM